MSIGNLLSVGEAATIIGVSTARVRQMLIAGDLPGKKLNRRAWALYRRDVERFAGKEPPRTGRPRGG